MAHKESETKKALENEAAEIKGAATHMKDAIKHDVKMLADKGKEKVNAATEKVDNYIKEHPKKSTAIAVGVGAAIGTAATLAAMRKRNNNHKNSR